MSDLPVLKTPTINAHFDATSGISYITYTGEIDGRDTSQLYEWVRELLSHIGDDATYGVVYDFTAVTKFAPNNLTTTRRESKKINNERDNTTHPIAMIVSNLYQEQMVRVTTKVSPHEDRKRIVNSMEEALDFIKQWHQEDDQVT